MFSFSSLFTRPEVNDRPRRTSIIWWWEVRRIPYNLLVGISGILSLIVFLLIDRLPPQLPPEARDIEPLSVIAFGVVANICFTCGWITELMVQAIRPDRSQYWGPRMFRYGLYFSIGLTWIPTILNALTWIVRTATGHEIG